MRIPRQDEMKMVVHNSESYNDHLAAEQICRLRYDVHHQCQVVVINKNDRGVFAAGVSMPAGKTFLKSCLTTSFSLTETSHNIKYLCARTAFLRTIHQFRHLRAPEGRFHARYPHYNSAVTALSRNIKRTSSSTRRNTKGRPGQERPKRRQKTVISHNLTPQPTSHSKINIPPR